MNLIEIYNEQIEKKDIEDNPFQREVLARLQRLKEQVTRQKRFFLWPRKKQLIKGVYIHGPVGVGKTYLMDLFYDNLPIKAKARFHFHYFMQQVDKQLRQLQGTKNPLLAIAASIKQSTLVLCFDEFMVNDVVYAMILGELMQALFAQGIILVATSNSLPDNLYWNGVQRQRFLPAIEALKTYCDVLCLQENKDYRLGREIELETYVYPLGKTSEETLCRQFKQLAHQVEEGGNLLIQHREIPFIYRSETFIWFDFRVICNTPRSQLDYLEIADKFDTIFVSDVPQLTERDTLFAILLIHFIDVMYDRGVRLVISAAVPLPELYRCGEMSQPFKRTLSRLQEMQSVDYLRRHRYRKAQGLSTLSAE